MQPLMQIFAFFKLFHCPRHCFLDSGRRQEMQGIVVLIMEAIYG